MSASSPGYEVQCMILLESDPRNCAILRILYGGGLRVSELCAMRWKDIVQRDDQVQVTILGKGGKKRHLLLDPHSSAALMAITKSEGDDYIFTSHLAYGSEHITERQVQNIVKEAAKRTGIERWQKVSPHWLRHSHATHSIMRGAPLPLVRDTLGHANISTTNIYARIRPGDSSSRFLPSF